MVLFGHPNILYLMSHLSGELLYEAVDRVVPYGTNYSINLTDGQVSVVFCLVFRVIKYARTVRRGIGDNATSILQLF